MTPTWFNTQKDTLPDDGQRVYVSFKGVTYGAIYSAEKKMFLINEDIMKAEVKSAGKLVYWRNL